MISKRSAKLQLRGCNVKNNLKYYMQLNNTTQTELARNAGIAEGTIRSILTES